MKRLLIVLFGVLVFQGSVWATTVSCLKNWPPEVVEDSHTQAKVLYPAEEGLEVAKKAPLSLIWHESLNGTLGKNVYIRLYEWVNGKTDIEKHDFQEQDNTGYWIVTKQDFRTAKVKKNKKYYFEVQSADNEKSNTKIRSECFTFNVKQKEDGQCNDNSSVKDCLQAYVTANNKMLARLDELEKKFDALEGGGGTVARIMVPGEGTNVLGDATTASAMAEDENGQLQKRPTVTITQITTPTSDQVQVITEVVCDGSDPKLFNWQKCKGKPWDARNGNSHRTNPVCWGDHVEPNSGANPWVVGVPGEKFFEPEAYACRRECAIGADLNYCNKDGWWEGRYVPAYAYNRSGENHCANLSWNLGSFVPIFRCGRYSGVVPRCYNGKCAD